MTSENNTRARKRRTWLAAAVLIVAVVAAAGLVRFRDRDTAEAGPATTYTVIRGPLTISVTEAGTIKPSAQQIIKSEIEGRTTILYLIEEGARVEKGDLLIELDASALQDGKLDQEISMRNAESAFIQSRENLEVVKNQAQSDVDQAELNHRFAKEDLTQYREGEYPNALKDYRARITLAEETLRRAEEKLKWSRVLLEEKYISESEYQADELEVKKAQLDLDLARNELALLTEYTYPRRIDELESQIKQTGMALERVRRKSSASVVQAEADLRAKELEFERQSEKLEKIEQQIAKARIEAPRDGLVIYATSTKFSWRGDDEPLQEGQEVRERQELIHLPTASTFIAEVSIHESSLEKIEAGLPVRITVDALQGREFEGQVTSIAPLPDPTSVFMNPDLKVYKTEIRIAGGGDVLRTGMTCQAEIVVARYDAAVYVPVQCVVRVNGRPSVFVVEEGEAQPRPVELGLDNNRMVHVLEGLTPGERVLLTPPLEQAGVAPEASGKNAPSGEAESGKTRRRPEGGPPRRGAERMESDGR